MVLFYIESSNIIYFKCVWKLMYLTLFKSVLICIDLQIFSQVSLSSLISSYFLKILYVIYESLSLKNDSNLLQIACNFASQKLLEVEAIQDNLNPVLFMEMVLKCVSYNKNWITSDLLLPKKCSIFLP